MFNFPLESNNGNLFYYIFNIPSYGLNLKQNKNLAFLYYARSSILKIK